MHARFARLSSAAAAIAVTTVVFGSPVAQAADGDAEFLATLAGLGIEFATPDEAVAAGNNICDIVSEGNGRPYRVHVRAPCFYAMGILKKLVEGHMLADIIPTFDTLNMIGGEVDR